MKHQRSQKKKYDVAYDGYQTAINTSPMLKNSSSGRMLAKTSGIPFYQLMRQMSQPRPSAKQKAEEEQLRADERIAELIA